MVQSTDTKNRVPGVHDMLARLISLPSISSASPDWDHSNEAVVRALAEWLEALGFAIEILEVPGMPGKYNLIATLGSGPGGLVLSGHTDTVPFDDKRWQTDPFTLTEKDGRWYGLGTCDMKAFFALAIEAAKRFIDLAFEFHNTCSFLTGPDQAYHVSRLNDCVQI